MVYTKRSFVDHVTPLNASNMNIMDDGIYDNQAANTSTQADLNHHELVTNVVHVYANVSNDLAYNASYHDLPLTLDEEIEMLRYQLSEVIGAEWNSSDWYNNNISSFINDISNISSDIENISSDIVTLDSQVSNISANIENISSDIDTLQTEMGNVSAATIANESLIYDRIFPLSMFEKDPDVNDLLIGGGRVEALYRFPNTVTLEDVRMNVFFDNISGYIGLEFNNSEGTFISFAEGYANASGYFETINLSSESILTSDGLEIEIVNESQVKSLNLVLNYKNG